MTRLHLLPVLTFLIDFHAPAFAGGIEVFQFVEVDGDSHILYKASCQDVGTPTCYLTAITVSTDKSPRKCTISVDALLRDEPAKKSNSSSSAYRCAHTGRVA
jgi:hypothetical protein